MTIAKELEYQKKLTDYFYRWVIRLSVALSVVTAILIFVLTKQ